MPASRTRYQGNIGPGPLLTVTVITALAVSQPGVSALPQISLPGQDIRDIFLTGGTSVRSGIARTGGGGYSGHSSASLDPNADILVESDRTFPDCSDYSDQLGYQCVPYYQCANGTI